MHILAIGPTPPPYHGVAMFLRQLMAAPLPADVRIEHLDTADRRDASNLGQWDTENLRLGFAHLSALAGHCLHSRPDVVYLPISQNVPAFLRDALFIIQSRMIGAHVVIHLHGGFFRTLYDTQPKWFQEIVHCTLKLTSGAVVLAPEFLPIFDGLMHPDRVFVVENGAPDPGAWTLRFNRPLPDADAGTLLYMGTLTQTKGIMKLLDAVRILRQKRPKLRLRVAGRWQEESLHRDASVFIAQHDLAGAVEFVGNVDGAEKATFLASGDLFCLPTFYPYEGQPLVILEAMAAGLPILSTTQGAIPSTAPDGLVGRLLAPDAPSESLAQTAEEMLCHAAQLQRWGNAGRQRYVESYALNICHERLLEVFQAVAGKFTHT
jgi:glycosyltransferase involved in cell wall biosynthesis